MFELFRAEAENQTGILAAGLLELERNPDATHQLEALMRAAHSMKGAARIIGLPEACTLAHVLEECFIAAQRQMLRLGKTEVDILLRGVDLLSLLSKCTSGELRTWAQTNAAAIEAFMAEARTLLTRCQADRDIPAPSPEPEGAQPAQLEIQTAQPQALGTALPQHSDSAAAERPRTPLPAKTAKTAPALTERGTPADQIIRLSAGSLSGLLALAGEWLVETGRIHPFTRAMAAFKRMQFEAIELLSELRLGPDYASLSERACAQLHEIAAKLQQCHELLSQQLEQIDLYDRRCVRLAHRLYHQLLRVRMRPFGDVVAGFARMVRDLAQSVGKQVRLEIIGEKTPADREVLEKLEAPLAHLVRNAVDHGCQTPQERTRAGKPIENLVRIEARHCEGMLLVTVSDDGAGIDLELLRAKIVQRKLASAEAAAKLTESELLEFLFAPGFSTKEAVTELSGRGVGLDIVKSMIRGLHGTIRVSTRLGQGTTFTLQMPLTLSVQRALVARIGGEPYAFPLAQVERVVRVDPAKVQTIEGRQCFELSGFCIALVPAARLFDCGDGQLGVGAWPVVVLGRSSPQFGLIVEELMGECELIVRPLDLRLGKVHCISAAALLEDGSPVLIVDVEQTLEALERWCARCVSQAGARDASAECGPADRPFAR